MKKVVQKIKDTLSILNSGKGFTLIEMLVVVLIIGILAAIALPQYKLAVGKSKYAALKNTTKTLKDASDRYYLVHNSLPTKFDDLDVSFSINKEKSGTSYFSLSFKDGMICDIYNSYPLWYCYKNIFGASMYYWAKDNYSVCYAGTGNTTDVTNRICQQETNKTAQDCHLDGNNICTYLYY